MFGCVNAQVNWWVVRLATPAPIGGRADLLVGEWVRIKSRIIWHNHNTVILEYYMTDDSETQLKTLLWTTMRYVTLSEGKSTDHTGAVSEFLTATSMNLEIDGIQIKERVKSLVQELKKN